MEGEKLLRDLIEAVTEKLDFQERCIDLAKLLVTSKEVKDDLQEALKLTLKYNIALKDIIIRSLKRSIKAKLAEPKCDTCPYEHTNCTKTINPDGTTTCHKENEKSEQPKNQKEDE